MKTRERTSSGQRCPYCHDDVARSAQSVACTGCGSVHHRECFEERGACSIFACSSEATREVSFAGTLLRAFRDSNERARGYERSIPFSLTLLIGCMFAFGGILIALVTGIIFAVIPALMLLVGLPALYGITRSVAFGVTLVLPRSR